MNNEIVVNLNDVKSIYFLGIGGIGMSGLARYFQTRSVNVKGYDKTITPLTRKLEEEGMDIQYIEKTEHLPDHLDLVVWTPAIPGDSLLLHEVKQRKIPLLKRSAVLGLISREMTTLAVAGTHGKTTTSTMLAHLLKSSSKDCTAFVGGISSNYGSNYIQGDGDYLVLEADEFDRSFLQLKPMMAILTSMDPDHLDIYGSPDEMKSAYEAFLRLVDKDGLLVVHHPLMADLGRDNYPNAKTYGIEAGDYSAERIEASGMQVEFDFVFKEGRWDRLRMQMPGEHNISNAISALALAKESGVTESEAREALGSFKGIKRRFELIGCSEQIFYIDDYAHHPGEIEAIIKACRQSFPGKKLTGIFQPHLYSRTRDFSNEFAEALDELDECIVIDIYPARELPIEGVDAKLIVGKMKGDKVCYMKKGDIISLLKKIDIEILLTIGAGDIDQMVIPIKEALFKD